MDIYGRFDGDSGYGGDSIFMLTPEERADDMSYRPMMNERMGARAYGSGDEMGQNDGFYTYDNINSYRHVQAAYPGQKMPYSQFTQQTPPQLAPKQQTTEDLVVDIAGDKTKDNSSTKKDRIILLLHIALAFAFLALIALGFRVEYLQTRLNDMT